ncbi:N-acetyltransferase family protein [Bacillus sp. Bva_UNVM-123]|uniref:N-acetyltransferase family protein n=1 Tax=Bacillus sp. Bva_UNVM-123 TaxID=2829798 RepID=UPI00391F5DF7
MFHLLCGNKAVGNALLSTAIKLAKELNNIEQVYLAVEKKNSAARKLYSSFGFEVYGEEKRALKIGDEYFDEEHMVLFL